MTYAQFFHGHHKPYNSRIGRAGSKLLACCILLACASCTADNGSEGSTSAALNANHTPSIHSNDIISVSENQNSVVTVEASDEDGDDITYAISGGEDAALFSIDTASGVLTFISSPNYEDPRDVDSDNIYMLEVSASDGQEAGTQILTVTVNDRAHNKHWDMQFGGTGNDESQALIKTSNGNFLAAGYSASGADGNKSQTSRGYYDYWAVKIDTDGNKIWDKRFGGSADDFCQAAAASIDGSSILAGYSASPADGDRSQTSQGSYDYWAVKVDSNGNKVWDKRFGGSSADYCYAIASCSDGGSILAGYTYSGAEGDKSQTSRGSYDFWTIKIDSDGNKVWDKRFGGSSADFCKTVTECPDGSFLLAGFSISGADGDKSEDSRGFYDYWVVKIDSDGNKIWDKRFGGSQNDYCYSVITDSDGNYLLGGYSYSEADGDKSQSSRGGFDYWLVKIDSDGNKIWDKRFGTTATEMCYSLSADSDNSISMMGHSSGGAEGDRDEGSQGYYDYWVIKVNSDGQKTWDKRFGGNGYDFGKAAVTTNGDGIILNGFSDSNMGDDKSDESFGYMDFWLIKYDENPVSETLLAPIGIAQQKRTPVLKLSTALILPFGELH